MTTARIVLIVTDPSDAAAAYQNGRYRYRDEPPPTAPVDRLADLVAGSVSDHWPGVSARVERAEAVPDRFYATAYRWDVLDAGWTVAPLGRYCDGGRLAEPPRREPEGGFTLTFDDGRQVTIGGTAWVNATPPEEPAVWAIYSAHEGGWWNDLDGWGPLRAARRFTTAAVLAVDGARPEVPAAAGGPCLDATYIKIGTE